MNAFVNRPFPTAFGGPGAITVAGTRQSQDPATALARARRFLRDATSQDLAQWFERRYDDSGATDLAAYEAATDLRSHPAPADRPYADPVYWAASRTPAHNSGLQRGTQNGGMQNVPIWTALLAQHRRAVRIHLGGYGRRRK